MNYQESALVTHLLCAAAKLPLLSHTQQVNLSYARTDKQDYLSVSGTAELVHDKKKMQALWSPWLKPWFPKGPDDPELALLKVGIIAVEYWDAPDSAMARAYGLVKAVATGDRGALGEHRKIDVK